MSDDWDLGAIVRSCSSTKISSNNTTSFNFQETNQFLSPPEDPYVAKVDEEVVTRARVDETRARVDETNPLQELYQPFLPELMKPTLSPLSVLAGIHDPSPNANKKVAPSPRTKRRKNQPKRVCQVAVEDLASDPWSWRKYGQKPIKGSPYPRGYYKCSTSKGCLARKQVERSRTDPGMFIVTYTAEHNHPMPTHRSSLAGMTRIKPEGPPSATADQNKPLCLSPPTAAEKKDDEDERDDFLEIEDEDDFGGSDMVGGSDMIVTDDFFEGLEGFTGHSDGDFLPDHFPGNEGAKPSGGED